MDNRPNGSRSVASEFLVLEKGKLHSPAAEKVTGLEGVRKTEAAPRNSDAAGGPVRSRALQARFTSINHRKKIIGVLRDNPKHVSGIQLAEGELFGVRFRVAISELLPV